MRLRWTWVFALLIGACVALAQNQWDKDDIEVRVPPFPCGL